MHLRPSHVGCDVPGCLRVHPKPHASLGEARAGAAADGWRHRMWQMPRGISPIFDFCPEHSSLADSEEPPLNRPWRSTRASRGSITEWR